MRTDAKIDRSPVSCPNASHLGFDKWKAGIGDIILTQDGTVGRMIGRVRYAPATGDKERETYTPEIHDWILAIVLNPDLGSVSERWINPQDVARVQPVRDRKKLLEFFFSSEFVLPECSLMVKWAESGFATLQDYMDSKYFRQEE